MAFWTNFNDKLIGRIKSERELKTERELINIAEINLKRASIQKNKLIKKTHLDVKNDNN